MGSKNRYLNIFFFSVSFSWNIPGFYRNRPPLCTPASGSLARVLSAASSIFESVWGSPGCRAQFLREAAISPRLTPKRPTLTCSEQVRVVSWRPSAPFLQAPIATESLKPHELKIKVPRVWHLEAKRSPPHLCAHTREHHLAWAPSHPLIKTTLRCV